MTKFLITGSNSTLSKQIIERVEELEWNIIRVSSSSSADYKLDFCKQEDCESFFEVLYDVKPNYIIHTASPYSGSYSDSDISQLISWSTFPLACHVIAHYCVKNPTKSKGLVIGSISGVDGSYIDSLSLYSQYKANLRGICEASSREGADLIYLNLGSFREDGDGNSALNTSKVTTKVVDLIQSEKSSKIMHNLVPLSEEASKCSGDFWE